MTTINTSVATMINDINSNFYKNYFGDDDYFRSTYVPLIYTSGPINRKLASTVTLINPRTGYFTQTVYNNINKDDQVIKAMVKYYYYKILDKWIYKDLQPLLAFLEIENGKPRMIRSTSDFNIEKLASNTEADVEAKISYMENVLLTKDIVKHILKKFLKKYSIEWTELKDWESDLKKFILGYLKDKFVEAIVKQ